MQAEVLTVREAAAKLGISGQRVRQLISAGSLPARRSSAGWLISADVVARKERRPRGRPASPRTAWGVLCMLSSAFGSEAAEPPACLLKDPRLRYRVVQVLSAMPDPAVDPKRWRALLASRGHVERMWVHPGLLSRLVQDPQVRMGGAVAAARIGEGLSDKAVRDVYVDESDAKQIVASYRLRPDPEGQVILHVVPKSVPKELVQSRGELVPVAASAADLLDEDDPRALRSALQQLHAMLKVLADKQHIRRPYSAAPAEHGRGPEDPRGPSLAS